MYPAIGHSAEDNVDRRDEMEDEIHRQEMGECFGLSGCTGKAVKKERGRGRVRGCDCCGGGAIAALDCCDHFVVGFVEGDPFAVGELGENEVEDEWIGHEAARGHIGLCLLAWSGQKGLKTWKKDVPSDVLFFT